jgi:predicted phage-related endonuclease
MQEMAEAEVGTVGGEKAVTWRTQTRSSIDVSALKKEMPDLASKYTRTTTMRVFRVS